MLDGYIYQKEWKEYRRRRNVSLLAFFLAFPIFISMALVLHLFGDDLKDHLALQLIMFAGWAVIYLWAVGRFNTWNCPRCHNRFFTYSFWVTSPIFLAKCRSCDLPKYSGSTFGIGV
ncbi:MAG: hypothetical protein KBF52_03045 [Pyrinomonadaceae bacterium]|nr:hypothetical protein [Pyrinomonadaceae bacterium]